MAVLPEGMGLNLPAQAPVALQRRQIVRLCHPGAPGQLHRRIVPLPACMELRQPFRDGLQQGGLAHALYPFYENIFHELPPPLCLTMGAFYHEWPKNVNFLLKWPPNRDTICVKQISFETWSGIIHSSCKKHSMQNSCFKKSTSNEYRGRSFRKGLLHGQEADRWHRRIS